MICWPKLAFMAITSKDFRKALQWIPTVLISVPWGRQPAFSWSGFYPASSNGKMQVKKQHKNVECCFHCACPPLLHSAPAPGMCSHSYRTLPGAGQGEGWGGQRCPRRCGPAHMRRDGDWRWQWGQSLLLLARSQQFPPPSTVQSHQAHSQVSLLTLTSCP